MEELKRCSRCKQYKAYDAFATKRIARDGKQYWCKACRKTYADNHREDVLRWNRGYYARNKKRLNAVAMENYRQHKPVRLAVRKALYYGEIAREPCIECGKSPTVGHHEDYDKPLDITWLCCKCHYERHSHQTNPPFGIRRTP